MNNNISLKIVVAETSVIVRSGLAAVLKRIPNLNAHPIEVSSPEALRKDSTYFVVLPAVGYG